jgi:hypothetical protein
MTGGRALPVSLANSAALLRFPEAMATGCGRASCSMVRRRFPPCNRGRARLAAGDDAGKRTDRGARTGARRCRGLRQQLRRRACDARRHRRLRLCRRLSAPCADRHAGGGRRAAHAHAGRVSMDKICIDLRPAGKSRRWRDGDLVGRCRRHVPGGGRRCHCRRHRRLRTVLRAGGARAGRSKSIDGQGQDAVFLHRMRCQSSPKWQGQCPGCGQWNTLVEP